ncbi:MAG: glycosyltransferase family 4 protein [Chloroflexi bacterium]|nr:glycosyltransferase family 4 protein [Chloroflexota bacterium]
MSPRVLLVSYWFPPAGGSSVQRVLKFAKYLPENGWQTSVLTVKDPAVYYLDDDLEKEIPHYVNVYRTRYLDSTEVYKSIRRVIRRRSNRAGVNGTSGGTRLPELRKSGFEGVLKSVAHRVLIPDGNVTWLPFAVRKGLEIIRREKTDVVLTSAPPYSVHLIGWWLAKLTGKPWVADYRDLWGAGDPFAPISRFRQGIDRIIERQILRTATEVVTATPTLNQKIPAKDPSVPKEKFHLIVNGFDPEDFKDIRRSEPDGKFTITFTGGVTPPGTARTFLTAVSELPPHIKEDLQATFYGGLYDADRELITELGLEGCVRTEPFISRREVLERQAGSHVLLLLINPLWVESLPGKLFEYIANRRPILALIPPEGDAAQLIRSSNAGIIVPWPDVEEARRQLLSLYEQHKQGSLNPPELVYEAVRPFERRTTGAELADLLSDIVERNR